MDVVQTFVADFCEDSNEIVQKSEPGIVPTTFTLWRRIALKQLRRIEQNNQGVCRLDLLMQLFATEVDCELLQHVYKPVLVSQYKEIILTQHKYLPEDISQFADRLHESPSFKRLVNALAEFLTLMELCHDLVTRLQDYGITQYIDEE